MIILAIETSCDDTCVAVLEAKGRKNPSFKILSNIVSSQVKIHRKWGGVYPILAKREHQRNLAPVLKQALSKARLLKSKIKNQKSKIDLIAVTAGPGLEPCLWVGVNFAKELAEKLKAPLIPVNHIEAHISANCLTWNVKQLELPAVCLIVSGGHTQLILMKAFGKYKILGETRDDAAGECFDKAARILGLGYPGGPIISKLAQRKNYGKKTTKRDNIPIKLPRPMIYQKNYDFSFSGLKTAVLYKVRDEKQKAKNEKYIQAMCAEVQQAIIDVLIYKTLKAAKNYKVKTILLGGGVAANDELRKQLKKACSTSGFEHLVPPKNLCTDNAAMVGAAAYFHWLTNKIGELQDIEAKANLRLE